jgi:peptidoglycan/xylan/chitin deacetylase (PgdA/CDA1 family)
VQNHTWAHPDLSKVGRDQFFSEINATNDAIVAAGARRPGCLRPPYGARNSSVDGWAAEAGLRITLWQVDPQDWRRPGVDVIVDNIVRFARPGSVILLHDGGGNREQSVAALDRALYRFEALAC